MLGKIACFAVGFFVGAWFGFGVMALLNVASRTDREDYDDGAN